MVTSSSPAVSLVGVRVLADGGNAVDAALAMTAMSWLTLPGQCGIGGDAFAVVPGPAGRGGTGNGRGYGPAGAAAGSYPPEGPAPPPPGGGPFVALPGAP